MSEKGIVRAFIDSILTPETRDTVVDWAEVGLDRILDNEAVKELPVVKTILAVRKGILGLKGSHLVQKIIRFLKRLEDVSEDEKKAFLEKLATDEKYTTQVMDNLLLLLDRLDDADKATIVGELFKSLIRGSLTVDEFKKLSSIVEKAFISDLQALMKVGKNFGSLKFAKPKALTSDIMKQLAALGLLTELIMANNLVHQARYGGGAPPSYHFEYTINPLGAKFLTACEPLRRNGTKHSVVE